jgi:mannosyltransferase
VVIERWAPKAITLLIALDVVAGVALRFKSSSKLWLDEAQSVNISQHSYGQIIHYLRHDGAPPLYYVVLHLWMKVVGATDFDVRALSGLFGVLALVVTYFAARAWWGRFDAMLSLAVLAILPYGIYFSTETRMYSLVMLLSAGLIWVLRVHLDRPRVLTAGVIFVLGSALLYTHYWAIYLLGVIGLYSLIRIGARRKDLDRREWLLPAALTASFVSFLPWVPIFNSQRLHTGTPWSAAPTLYQLFTWFDGFSVNQSVPHIVGSLHTEVSIMVFVATLIFGIFGYRMLKDSRLIQLDYRGVAEIRTISFIVLATMAIGLVTSHFGGSAYVPRYAAVIAVPLCFIIARGVSNFVTPLRILIVLVVLSGAFLWTDKWGVGSQRTQAGQIATALASVPAGAIVFVCPDQLGPSLLRYSNPTLTYVGYPRFENPAIVDWYDYLAKYKQKSPAQYADQAASMVGAHQRVFVVRAHFYGLKFTCWHFATSLASDLQRVSVPIVKENVGGFYQPMQLQELVAKTP